MFKPVLDKVLSWIKHSFSKSKSPHSCRSVLVSLKIVGTYIIIGSLWILLSDKVVELLVQDTSAFRVISQAKGWIYVLVTAYILYKLIKASLLKIEAAQDEITNNYNQLAITHEQLEKTYKDLEAYQDKLRSSSLHDDLTGLPNRLALYEDITEHFSKPNQYGAICLIDLDNFKYVNDYLGHAVGDELLQSISCQLKETLTCYSTLYRFGGDEFVVHLKNTDYEKLIELMTALHNKFSEPIKLSSSTIHTTISTGIALYPKHGHNLEELLKHADIALYQAKETRFNKFVIFDSSMTQAVTDRITIEQGLREALKNGEFQLHYQPQYSLKTEKICGFEALLRWKNPELGLVYPDKFIPIAEQSGLIVQIGKWVLEKACSFIKELQQSGFTKLTIAVNVSILQLLQPDYVQSVIQILEKEELDPEYLEIEITESALMESHELIKDKLELLRAHGVNIALDDFGTGYSSLYYLRELPITTLKIDKSFIDDIGAKNRVNLLATIIEIGKIMGLLVTAEGVEELEQLHYLKKSNCDIVQGYHYSKPITPEEVLWKLQSEQLGETTK